MMRVITLGCILMLGVGMPIEHADAAKRFGGGASFGKFFATPKRVAPAPQKVTPTSGSKTTSATNPRRPGMGGLLGGMLAGGLLSALFFGGAFQGIQLMDILIIAVVGYLLFSFFARPRQSQSRHRYADGYTEQPYQQPSQQPSAFQADRGTDFLGSLGSQLAEAELEFPQWFNKEAFVEGAKQHFITLQKAWCSNDLELIQNYCAPEFYQLLTAERAKMANETLDNEVVSVMAEIIGFNEFDGQAQLSINFYGWMREGEQAEATEFNEIWHLIRNSRIPDADWYLVGIEQP